MYSNKGESTRASNTAPDVIKSVNAWAETPVQGKDLVVDKCGEGEIVKEVCEGFPHICIAVLAKTLVVEPVHLYVFQMDSFKGLRT